MLIQVFKLSCLFYILFSQLFTLKVFASKGQYALPISSISQLKSPNAWVPASKFLSHFRGELKFIKPLMSDSFLYELDPNKIEGSCIESTTRFDKRVKNKIETFRFIDILRINNYTADWRDAVEVFIPSDATVSVEKWSYLASKICFGKWLARNKISRQFEDSLGEHSLQGLNFDFVSLPYFDFSGRDLSDSTFQSARLANAFFRGAILNHVDFTNAFIKNANFENAAITNATFSHANCSDARFKRSYISDSVFDGAVLDYALFQKSYLYDVSMSRISGREMSFKSAQLTNVAIHNSDLKKANFQNANVFQTEFINCSLKYANFSLADLYRSIIQSSNLYESSLNVDGSGISEFHDNFYTHSKSKINPNK